MYTDSVSDLLSNQCYIGFIIRFDEFFLAQGEKVILIKILTSKKQLDTTLRVYLFVKNVGATSPLCITGRLYLRQKQHTTCF